MCVVALKGNNPSNCKQHMTNKHKHDMPGKEFRMHILESESVASSSIQKLMGSSATSGSAVARAVSSSASVGGGSSVGAFPFAKTKIPKLIIQRGNDLQLQFMRSCNIAARHGNSQDLKNYLDHVLDNSLFYNKNRSSMVMGRLKVSNQRYRSFNQLVNMVKGMVDRSREWLKVQTKSNKTPFITVGHDGWDSKDRDMLGICIHFVDMDKGKRRTIAVGLQQAHSKKSVPTAEQALSMLERYVLLLLCCCCCWLHMMWCCCCDAVVCESYVLLFCLQSTLSSVSYVAFLVYRYGIHKDDIFRAVNDTASPAIAAGLLISDGRRPVGGTTCQMHAVELVLKHAFGLVERRSGGQVIDSFVQGKELRDRCKALASKVMDKKAKARFAEYEALSMETWSVKPIKLKTPNATRVSGDYILIVSMLRAKSLLQVLVGQSKHTQAYKDCIIGSDDWKLIAEFEAVMSHIHHLAMTSQGDEPGEIAFSWFELSMCWLTYKSKDKKNTMWLTVHSPGPLPLSLKSFLLSRRATLN
jgi:hypothetical protein